MEELAGDYKGRIEMLGDAYRGIRLRLAMDGDEWRNCVARCADLHGKDCVLNK